MRCETPAMVRKEVWTHLLSYNVVRGVMAEAAAQADCLPREVSLAGAVQQLNAYLPYLAVAPDARERARLWQEMLRAIARHRVGDRPNRVEPRVLKRRNKNFPWMTEPRAQARKRMRKAG